LLLKKNMLPINWLIIFVPVSVSSHIHNVVDHAKGDMCIYKFIIHKQNKTKQIPQRNE